jgi:anti-sigma regulatory factor (Ser/Thr protein kinase)
MEVAPRFVPISERSAVGEVRRHAAALARAAGFDEEAAGRVAIVATEVAGNIVKHGANGHCFLSLVEETGEALVQVVAVDSGPGIADVGDALRDGYSTAGTPGTGLGAVQRLSHSFDLFSQADGGVVVVARIGAARPAGAAVRRSAEVVQVGAVASPIPGELVCGDAWALERDGARTTLLVADGLGHGPLAAEAANAAVAVFARNTGRPPGERVERMHEALRSTRGAAVAVAQLDTVSESVRYAGIGNIAAQIVLAGDARSLVSMNGTAGHVARTIREFSYDFPRGALLAAHSDGVSARWALDGYPGIALRDPALIAAVLHRDYGRGRDDATIVVARNAVVRSGGREDP